MKPFIAEQAAQGKPVITRDGNWKMIDHHIFNWGTGKQITALLEHTNKREQRMETYRINGLFGACTHHPLDLVMYEEPPATKEVWINVYWDKNADTTFTTISDNEKDAKGYISTKSIIFLQKIKAVIPV